MKVKLHATPFVRDAVSAELDRAGKQIAEAVRRSSARVLPNRETRRIMAAEDRTFPSVGLVEIPREDWSVSQSDDKRIAAFRNRHFLVQVFAESNGIVRLSVNRTAMNVKADRWRDGISWDDLQILKEAAGYGDCCAVEIYPPDGLVVDIANMRHLWVLPEAPDFMWVRS